MLGLTPGAVNQRLAAMQALGAAQREPADRMRAGIQQLGAGITRGLENQNQMQYRQMVQDRANSFAQDNARQQHERAMQMLSERDRMAAARAEAGRMFQAEQGQLNRDAVSGRQQAGFQFHGEQNALGRDAGAARQQAGFADAERRQQAGFGFSQQQNEQAQKESMLRLMMQLQGTQQRTQQGFQHDREMAGVGHENRMTEIGARGAARPTDPYADQTKQIRLQKAQMDMAARVAEMSNPDMIARKRVLESLLRDNTAQIMSGLELPQIESELAEITRVLSGADGAPPVRIQPSQPSPTNAPSWGEFK